jgi:hypothetical protein
MLRKWAVATVLILMMSGAASFAQGPLQKQVFYTINVDHALRMGDYILPAGTYELFQINSNDLNLFALYKNNRMHSPIAMIRTTRIDYQATGYPQKTKIMLTIDEEANGRENLPVLKGWTIPGFDGWEIISVVEKKKGTLARVNSGRELSKR